MFKNGSASKPRKTHVLRGWVTYKEKINLFKIENFYSINFNYIIITASMWIHATFGPLFKEPCFSISSTISAARSTAFIRSAVVSNCVAINQSSIHQIILLNENIYKMEIASVNRCRLLEASK